MTRRLPKLAASAVALSVLAVAASAAAEAPSATATPIRVLAVDSDDAIEQAEAITAALRQRITKAPGVSLVEDGSVLAVLTAANKCDAKPDAKCAEKIATKLGAERYVWGVLAKPKGQKGQVELEIHYWRKGQPDKVVKKSWSENLKDPHDPALAALAKEITGDLLDLRAGTVRATAKGASEIVVDGAQKVPVEGDTATVELGPGRHKLEAKALGKSFEKTVNLTDGQTLSVILDPVEATPAPVEASPFPTRKVAGIGAMVVGGGFLVGGVVAGAPWVLNGAETSRDFCADYNYGNTPTRLAACKAEKNGTARLHQALYGASVVGGAALVGVGAYLVFGGTKPAEKPAARRVEVTPLVGATQGLLVHGTF